jgi:hypothetical protein
MTNREGVEDGDGRVGCVGGNKGRREGNWGSKVPFFSLQTRHGLHERRPR